MGNSQATPSIGKKLDRVTFSQEHIDAGKVNCCVCLRDYVLERRLVQCPQCTQLFHAHCIRKNLKVSDKCPLCRYDFVFARPERTRRYYGQYNVPGFLTL